MRVSLLAQFTPRNHRRDCGRTRCPAWTRARRAAACSLLFLTLAVAAAEPTAAQVEHGHGRSAGRLAAGGGAGLLAGAAAGGLSGWLLYQNACTGYCETGGIAAVAGAGIGSTLALPLGVHLANDRRGSYALSLLASLVIAGAGAATMYVAQSAIDSDALVTGAYIGIAAAVPLAQLGAAMHIERRARSR